MPGVAYGEERLLHPMRRAGERLGLTIFSGAAVAVIPLTDDYEHVLAKLDEAD